MIGEGYTAAQMPKFRKDAERLVARALRRGAVQAPRRSDFNVRLLELPAAESGVNRPNAGVFRRTPFSAEYNVFDSERYVLTLDNRALRDAASAAPYEFIEILVNERTYGGGGIFNDQATVVGRQRIRRLRVRPRVRPSLRGAGRRVLHLGCRVRDGRAAETGTVGAERHGAARSVELKWRDLVTAGTPLPTPWHKEEFEKHSRAHPGTAAGHQQAQRAGERRWTRFSASSATRERSFSQG